MDITGCPVCIAWNAIFPSTPRISPIIISFGRWRRAAFSRSNIETSDPLSSLVVLVTSQVQFLWGTCSSGVSSIDTILDSGGRKVVTAFIIVVFPEAVSPETKQFMPALSIIHMYAAMV
ncbi:hypothetical protein SDC9_168443 [bioreactor metagenome]|uniref:Uncharacterized protein n=1 Tax=bioreactor metagenome TaxID=1076179 RepID=A0A645GAG8_9ZZZZ